MNELLMKQGIDRRPTCECAQQKADTYKNLCGFHTQSSHYKVGYSGHMNANMEGEFINRGIYLEANFCPECGAPYEFLVPDPSGLVIDPESSKMWLTKAQIATMDKEKEE